jgi:hypothetical protein
VEREGGERAREIEGTEGRRDGGTERGSEGARERGIEGARDGAKERGSEGGSEGARDGHDVVLVAQLVLVGGLDPANQKPLDDIWIIDAAGEDFRFPTRVSHSISQIFEPHARLDEAE